MADITPHPYTLIELGQASESFLQDHARHLRAAPHAYLFDNTPEAAIAPLGPLLVDTDAAPAALSSEIAEWENAFPHAVAHILTPLDLNALTDHLRARLTVKLPDGTSRLFRFYDALTLPVLHARLDKAQHEQFWSPIARWQYPVLDDTRITLLAARDPLPDRPSADHLPPEPDLALSPGHFRLSQSLWNELRLEADLRQVRTMMTRKPEFAWFSQLPAAEQNTVYLEIVDAPLRQTGLYSIPDLYTAAKICMRHPFIDMMKIEGMHSAIEQARQEEGSFDAALIEHVRPETWLELEETP